MSIIKGKQNVVAGFGGTKRCIGEVYFSQSSLASDNPGALPGWTGEYYENGKTLFPDLYNFVKAHSELQVTKAQYDSAIATYGECPKYVVDENTAQTSLRLPKLANYIKMANSTEGITQKGAGLPNITGDGGDPRTLTNAEERGTLSGAFYAKTSSTSGYGNTNNNSFNRWALMFDASKSNAIYGASDTVQPAHTTLYPWISAYTSAIPASTAQAAEFTGALSGKANTDLSNVLANIDYVVESVVNTDGSWYRKYKSGWLEQGGKSAAVAGGGSTIVTFPKAFANTTYTVLAQVCGGYTPQAEANAPITAQTKTGFTIYSGSVATSTFNWRAEGQEGGTVTPEPSPEPKPILHKYAWKAQDNTLVYADVKELAITNDTVAYLSPYTNDTFSGTHSNIMRFSKDLYRLFYGDKTQDVVYSHEITE